MDVDQTPQAYDQPPLASSSNDPHLEDLSSVLEQLETYPDNVTLIKKQVALMTKMQMIPEVLDATMRLSSLVMLSEDEWLAYLDQLIRAASSPLSLDGFVDILERFEQAEQDYLSLAILLRHIEFVLACAGGSAGIVTTDGNDIQIDEEVSAFLAEDVVRGTIRAVLARGSGLLVESHLLWQPYLDWEIRLGDLARVHEAFTDRLSIPHSTMDETSSAYSSYLSENWPDQYEAKMVQATASAGKAKFQWGSEKRFGKTREDLEQQLASSDPLQAFPRYIDWETDPFAMDPKHERAPSSDPTLIRSVFERAIASCSRGAFAAETSLTRLPKPKKKGKHKTDPNQDERQLLEQTFAAYKDTEANLWTRYGGWERWNESVTRRATRACPQKGSLWAHRCNQLEMSAGSSDILVDVFEQALSLGTITEPGDIADIFIARAASVNRNQGDAQDVFSLVTRGFDAIVQVKKSGDPSLRLEKFAVNWAEIRAPSLLNEVLSLVDRPMKSRSSAYQMVLLKADVEMRRSNIEIARTIFATAIQRTDLDWPEAIYEAYDRFEVIHGSLETLADAKSNIEVEQQKLAKRREKASQGQMDQYYAAAATAEPPADQQTVEPTPDDPPVEQTTGAADANQDSNLKRDRENTTILVSGFAEHAEKEELEAYFIDCGHIREITVEPRATKSVALVEFRFADAVPRALEKDGKKLMGRTIHVSMLWRSTLFVTNFPRHMDEAGLLEMFGQYGTVLQTRWPARKFADNRRFCYIAMDSPASAQESLVLNGMKLEEFPLTVLISDPTVKTKRSDKDPASGRTLFVGGLTSKTTQSDVEQILQGHGDVAHIKLGWDPIKSICKGFAFVEMATKTAATSCLQLSGNRLNGRILKIELSDPNHASKKPDPSSASGARAASDKRERTIRLHNLPEGTQEGLLQQELEKIAPVSRIEVFARTNEAIAELPNQSDVGKLLLRAEPFVFQNATITFSQQARQRATVVKTETASALSFAPRAARRGGKQLANPRPQAQKAAPALAREPNEFRAFVESKNLERSEASKRKAESTSTSSPGAKRSKS